jgi:AcrR family transcriptional regulator
MPHSPKRKSETRERIITSARRLFNRKGFTEVTIDEIMEQAGLTRGGFYRHFATKDELYAVAVRQFLCADPPEAWQRKHVDACAEGARRARMIVEAYLSREHFDDRDGSCPLVALPSDVARAGAPAKAAFRMVLDRLIGLFTANLAEPAARPQALTLISMCVGAMVIARAVDDPALADEFRAAALERLMATTGWGEA